MNEIAEQIATVEDACPRASRHHHVILTPREREVALLVERNLSNDEIARKLGIKPGTVKIHMNNIFIKGGLSPRSRRSSNGRKTDAVRERISEAQQRL